MRSKNWPNSKYHGMTATEIKQQWADAGTDATTKGTNRLFDLVKPKHAVFGEKDFQQLFLIKEMVAKLQIPVNIVSAPTIRDVNELALSSRNTRLTESEKKAASVIFQALSTDDLKQAKAVLDSQPSFKLDYLNLIDEKTFTDAHPSTENKRLIIAGCVNQVRLIDNKAIGGR